MRVPRNRGPLKIPMSSGRTARHALRPSRPPEPAAPMAPAGLRASLTDEIGTHDPN